MARRWTLHFCFQRLSSQVNSLRGLTSFLLMLAAWVSAGAADLTIHIQPQTDGPWQVTRLSYLLSHLTLGEEKSVPDFLGWLTKDKERVIVKNLKPGRYKSIGFDIALSKEDNARDPSSWPADHPLNPRICGLHWSWQGGYIFMALEGTWKRKDGTQSGFAYHLGNDFMRTHVTVPVDLDLTKSQEITLALEVAAILKGIDFLKDGASTHSADDDPVAYQLRDNLQSAFKLISIREAAPFEAKTAPPVVTLQRGTLPLPQLPADNPLTPERVSLGKRLFHETALSRDNSISCASCHVQGSALSDPRPLSLGVDGRAGERNAMPLFNLAWKDHFFWDGRVKTLREQVMVPIQDHREMDESFPRVLEKLKDYASDFEKAFGTPGITQERLGLALEAHLLTLTSHDSKFDRAQRGELKLSADEQRGFELFMTEREPRLGTMGADCFHCHGGALFTDHQFRNNGLDIDERDTGRHRVTQSALDRGTFVTPSLRNIALTAPYMHDGRFKTLEEVLDHYSTGVKRTDTLDPNLAKHPDGGLGLSEEDKRCVIAFLKTLTDEEP
jgi:cytochrome c peroxidase